jgi:hypothetical protein
MPDDKQADLRAERLRKQAEAIQASERSPGLAPNTRTLENMERGFAAGPARTIEESEQSSEKTVPNPAPETASPMHARDTRLFADLGIPVAILVATGAVGLGGIFAGWPHCGAALCVVGFGGALAMRLRLVETEPSPALRAPFWRGFLIAVAVLTWVFVGLQMWLWLHTPTQGYTQAQLDKAVADGKAPIQAKLDAAQKTITDLKSASAPPVASPAPAPATIIAPQQPLAAADMPRVYTNKTVQGLAAFYKDRTDMQGDVFMADEKGKWINTEGKLQYTDGRGARLYNDGHTILCDFGEKWKAKLGVLRPSAFIKITGKIRQDQWLPALLLEQCELRD